jgi:carbonic anhydrase
MRKGNLLRFSVSLFAVLMILAAAPGAGPVISPDDAVKLLKEGNERFLAGKPQYPRQSRERRALTAGQGQHPFAAVLSCSDSRVPVEIIFDQGIGDIFVVRVAGNVAAVDEVGSLEYAVDHFETPALVVLGHSQCGEVTAIVAGEKVPANVATLVKPILPAVDKAKAENPGASTEALINAAIKANIWQAIEDLLEKSPIIRGMAKEGKTKVLGALYEVDTGQVQWLGPHPEQDKLLGVGAKPGPKGKKKRQEL